VFVVCPCTMFSILDRLIKALTPAFILSVVTVRGIFPAIRQQLSAFSIRSVLSPRQWWSAIFATGFPYLLQESDKTWAIQKRQVVTHASGNILEVGPGAGHTIAYYDASKVTKIVGIEPFAALHPLIRAAVERAKLTDKYDLVCASIEDSQVLAEHGVLPGTMDTIVCVQVLCSIPNPKQVIAEMYKLLKPGGQIVFFEHVRSEDNITAWIQEAWTTSIWHALTGCNLDRPSADWLQQIGEWSSVDIQPGPNESNHDIIPHHLGRLVKAT